MLSHHVTPHHARMNQVKSSQVKARQSKASLTCGCSSRKSQSPFICCLGKTLKDIKRGKANGKSNGAFQIIQADAFEESTDPLLRVQLSHNHTHRRRMVRMERSNSRLHIACLGLGYSQSADGSIATRCRHNSNGLHSSSCHFQWIGYGLCK
jgi:hypothetical protein